MTRWREFLELGAGMEPLVRTQDGEALIAGKGRIRYLGGWPDETAMLSILSKLASDAGISTTAMPEGVRMRRMESGLLVWNYLDATVDLSPLFGAEGWLLDGPLLPPSGVGFLPAKPAA